MQLPATLGTTQGRLGAPATVPTPEIGPTATTFPITFPSPRISLVAPIGPTPTTFTISLPSPRLSLISPIGPTPTTFPITFPPPLIETRFSGSIRPTSTRIQLNFPPPTLSGGDQFIHVFLGGVEVTRHLKQNSCKLTSATQGRWTASFDLWDKTGAGIGVALPTDATKGTGQAVMIVEGGNRRFMGCLNQWTGKRDTGRDHIKYSLDCIDKGGICDHRVVPTITYAAGTDIAEVVRRIWATCLDGEGITLDGVPASLGPLDHDETFDFVTVAQAFDTLATDAGAGWWIDVFGVLNFILTVNLPAAPFALTETSKNWQDLEISASLTNYRNKQYVKSNLSINPGGVPSTVETYTLPQAKAVAAGFRLGTIVLNFTASQIISFKVNGVSQPIQNGYDIGLNFDKSWWAILPTPYLYAPDATLPTPTPPLGFPYYVPTSPFPNIGDVIEIEYIPANTNAQVFEADALIPSLPGLSKCGSGVFEAVEQVKNIKNADHLLSIAQAILARSGSVPTSIKFNTFVPGLAVGQILTASIPKAQIPNGSTFVITNLSAIHAGFVVDKNGNQGMGHGSGFVWAISATSGIDQLNALGMFERLIARTENPLPIPIYEYDSIVIAPAGSLAAGIVDSNPAIALQTGKLTSITVQAGAPPTDQTLVLDVLVNGVSVLGPPNLIQIPSADGTQHVQLIFRTDPAPLYVFANDVITVSASYVVTGSNPSRAGSITLIVRRQV